MTFFSELTSHHSKIVYAEPSFSDDHVFGLLVGILFNLSGGVGSSLRESDEIIVVGVYVGSFVREQVIDKVFCFPFLLSNVSSEWVLSRSIGEKGDLLLTLLIGRLLLSKSENWPYFSCILGWHQ